MMKRLFSSQQKTITGAALVLGAASLFSRIIGVLRDRLFAYQFGAGEALDIYYAAFRIPDLIYNLLIAGALSAGFIPLFMELLQKNEKRAWHMTNNLLHALGVVLAIAVVLLFIAIPWLTPLLVPGFDAEATRQTVLLSRIMLFSPLILGISGLVSGVLQAKKHFFVYSLTPVFYNVGIILVALLFAPQYGVTALAWGVVLGALCHLGIQLPALFHLGYKYHRTLQWRHKDLIAIGKLMIPRTITLAVSQLNIIVTTVIASTLAAGSITVFYFANNLQFFPVGIIGISFALAAFPTLAESVAKKDKTAFIRQFVSTTKQILFFIIPLSIIFMLLRAQIVRIVLGSGKFDWNATITTANTLAFFTLSLFAQSLVPLLHRAFYALQNTKTPLHIAFVSMLINVIASLLLKDVLGVAGLALAFSLATMFQLTVLWVRLRIDMGALRGYEILQSLYKIIAVGLVMTLTIQLIKYPLGMFLNLDRFIGVAIQGGVAATAGIIVYIIGSVLLEIEEGLLFVKTLKKRWLRLKNVEAQVGEADEI